MSDSPEYTLRWRGRQFGPFSLPEINRRLDEHEIGMGHEIHYHDQWISLEEFFVALSESASTIVRATQKPSSPQPAAGLSPAFAGAPGVLPPKAAPVPLSGPAAATIGSQSSSERAAVLLRPAVPPAPAEPPSVPTSVTRPRHRLVYALLGVFLGFVGLHNFYARNWLTGLLQLLLSLATYLLDFGIIVPWLWALVEAVLVRKDGNGIEMI
jgi:TM2 domain-containing membrane protein YozV